MKDIEGQVRFLRLNNGEDIIAFAYHVPKDDIEDAHYIVNDPLKIIYMTTTKSTRPFMSISLMQWVFGRITDKQEFRIESRDVLFAIEPTTHLTEYYYETLEHIHDMRDSQKKEVEFGEDNTEDFTEDEEFLDESEGLQLLKDLLEQTKGIDKKKLH